MKRPFIFSLLWILLGTVFAFASDEQSDASAGSYEEASSESNQILAPPAQLAFVKRVCKAQEEEFQEQNELKRHDIAERLSADLQRIVPRGGRIERWYATLSHVDLDSKKRALVFWNIETGDENDCMITFSNVEPVGLFERRYHTLINPGSKLYKQFSEMNHGDRFVFSGRFVLDKRGSPRKFRDNYLVRLTSVERLEKEDSVNE